ncbi:MAG: prephenate dehydratase [Clostridia bacterium]|nr:prephenate dehydratase [Clostridia bacterium]
MSIGYLGPNGSYSHGATLKYKAEKDEIIEYDTITNVIKALENNEINKCIVPIENAIYGSVLDTMDAILEYKDIYIIDEVIVDINHILMSKQKDCQIARIYSHPQALAQCKKYLLENYDSVETIPVSSTSYAAKLAAKESGTACICNIACKDIYNLEVISDKIQEIKKNQTKFIVLSKEKNKRETKKTSLIFSTKDEPGALYKILGLFSLADINLTKIESRPAKTKLGDYMFFVDIDGDEKEERVEKAFSMIKDFCDEFRIIGSY